MFRVEGLRVWDLVRNSGFRQALGFRDQALGSRFGVSSFRVRV